MNWTDKAYLFTIENVIKIEIFNMMELRNTLVSDSDNWLLLSFSFQCRVWFLRLAKSFRSCQVRI